MVTKEAVLPWKCYELGLRIGVNNILANEKNIQRCGCQANNATNGPQDDKMSMAVGTLAVRLLSDAVRWRLVYIVWHQHLPSSSKIIALANDLFTR
mmetsp:Transcript_31811/g.54266  ORF Transcript_31811/g.54266 Transcript_31811/m.54266 type:complete len:96 (+) Transcript_31811:120-407(+)